MIKAFFCSPDDPSLICDMDHGLRLVRSLLNGQYSVPDTLQTIIYLFSVLDLPRSDLGRDLCEKCGSVLLLEAGDDGPMYTYRFADDLGEVLARFRRIRRVILYKVSEIF
jgi:hypothetical protein